MPHILAIEINKRQYADYNWIAPLPGASQPENVATLWVDWDNYKWEARTNVQGIGQVLNGVTKGIITTSHGYFFGASDQVLAAPDGSDLMVLQAYGLNVQAKLHGVVAFGVNKAAVGSVWSGKAKAFLYFTYFWRKLSGQDMTPRERAEEMSAIALNKYGDRIASDALNQVKGLAGPESLAAMAGILVLFATVAALGWAGMVAAMRVFCGTMDVATNWQMYKPYWDRFVQQVNTGNDLDYGAEALATLLGGMLGYGASNIVAAKISSKAAPRAQEWGNVFANKVRGQNAARWRATAEQGLKELKEGADKSGDPNHTKTDPGKNLSPEERVKLAEAHPELLDTIRRNAAKFGFPAEIAAGYAMLAFKNGWTIIARTSKAASIKYHSGMEAICGKSLFVQYKIDPEHGVIIQDGTKNIERDFYSVDSYAAKQMKAIYFAESPNAPKDSFHVDEHLMAEFRAAHKFEFRKIKMGNKEREVLFHNGRMVISDLDLMGIYVKRGQDLVPLPQWMLHNDAAFLKDYINRNVGGMPMSEHGQQDVGRNQQGQPFRSPDADERYAVFTPDLQLTEVTKSQPILKGLGPGREGTANLEVMYRKLHILWPYQTYVECGGAINAWCAAAARRRKSPR
jgi:hypothetical protein